MIVSLPEGVQGVFSPRPHRLEALDISDRDEIVGLFDAVEPVETVLGPAFWGYVDQESFITNGSAARLLEPKDESAYEEFQHRVGDEDWDRGGPSFIPGRTVGRFVEDDLAAVSGYEVWRG